MTESPTPTLGRWRYGMHPRAVGSRVRAMGRVDLPLGEALRIELVGSDQADGDEAHLQYYIATEAGPWALWITCRRDEMAAGEALLRDLVAPFPGGTQDQPPTRRERSGPLPGWDADRS